MPTVSPQRVILGVVMGVLALGWVLLALCFFGVELPRPSHGGGEPIDGSPIDFAIGERSPLAQPTGTVEGELANQPQATATPRNLILFLGDGMGYSHVAAARATRRGARQPLLFERLPYSAAITTFSAFSLYTDSAAGATALASGVAVPPGHLSVDDRGRPVRTLFEAAREAGKAIGLVTDSYLWDASPAAFVVHRESRREYGQILADMATSGADLLVGESSDHEGTEEAASVLQRQHRLAETWSDLEALESAEEPAAGLFAAGTIADREQEPTLAQLTAWAVRRLSRNPAGFFLFVETEEPDTGSHRHQIDRVLNGIAALDEAVAEGLEAPADTLVLVTADHETGGLGIVGGSADSPLEVAWTSTSHTAEPVPLYAWGPGASRFTGSLENTEVARRLADLFGFELTPSP
ncbi:MAG: alkaline phosphatase [Acidobacteriota bacterium]